MVRKHTACTWDFFLNAGSFKCRQGHGRQSRAVQGGTDGPGHTGARAPQRPQVGSWLTEVELFILFYLLWWYFLSVGKRTYFCINKAFVHLKHQPYKKWLVTIVVRNFHLIVLKKVLAVDRSIKWILALSRVKSRWDCFHSSIFLNITESKERVVLHFRWIFLGDFPKQLILLLFDFLALISWKSQTSIFFSISSYHLMTYQGKHIHVGNLRLFCSIIIFLSNHSVLMIWMLVLVIQLFYW